MTFQTFRTVQDMRTQVAAWKADGLRVGLVPTMGAPRVWNLVFSGMAAARSVW